MKPLLRALPFALCALQASAATFEDGLQLKNTQQLAAASSAFAEVAAREPGNAQAREQLAIVLGWQNRFAESIVAWREAIALAPQNPDYHVGLARVQYWQGERQAALQSLDTALRLQPGHTEAAPLRADVQRAEADAASQTRRWRLDVGYHYDRYNNARGSENSRFAQLGRRVGAGGDVLYARYDGYRHFGRHDNGLTLGAYWLPHASLLINLEAGRTSGAADFRPETQLQLNGEWLQDATWQPLLGYRHFQYDNGTVTTLTPGLRVLLGNTTAEARYGLTDNIDGRSTGVLAAKVSVQNEGYAPYVAFTKGSEALPPQAKAKITVLGAGVAFDLSTQWAGRLDYSYEDRKSIYKHHALGGGLTYRF